MSTLLIAVVSLSFIADATPIIGWNKQLFPSFIIGTSTMNIAADQDEFRLGDSDGLLGVSMVAPHDKAAVRVTVSCEGFLETSNFVGTLDKNGRAYQVYPKVKYRYDRLSKCRQATPATLTIQVQVDGGEAQEYSSTVTIRSINDCPLAILSGEQEVDTSFVLASFVNEQHPYIDFLLREALDIGVVEGFVGYQSKSEADVLRQVYAVWDLFVARDMRLSALNSSAAESTMVKSKPVRLLEETVNHQQANCLDGSVLLVSILRKIGIDASLVIVPGHCYVAFFVDEQHTKRLGIETTLLGTSFDRPIVAPPLLERSVLPDWRDDRSWPSFVAAVATASDSLVKDKAMFDDPKNKDYQIMNIADMRRMGVMPIPFEGRERFLDFDHSADSEDGDEGEEEDEEMLDETDWDLEEEPE